MGGGGSGWGGVWVGCGGQMGELQDGVVGCGVWVIWGHVSGVICACEWGCDMWWDGVGWRGVWMRWDGVSVR